MIKIISAATMSDDVKFRDISFGNQGDDKKNKNKNKGDKNK